MSVDYDPKGADTGRESIVLSYNQGESSSLDLSDFRLLVGTTKKTLSATIDRGAEQTITKTFGFPNTKATCVTLMHRDKAYDAYCYDPHQSISMAQTESSPPDVEIEIADLVYDPDGADAGRESVTLILHTTGQQSLSGFYLAINGKSKKLPDHTTLTS